MFTSDGERLLDVYNNVPHVGHAHPIVVEAIARVPTGTRSPHANVPLNASAYDQAKQTAFSDWLKNLRDKDYKVTTIYRKLDEDG